MRAFVSASVVGGSFMVGIGVGCGSGRVVVGRSFLPSLPPPSTPLTQKSRCWSAMAEEESARLWQVNRTIHELVKDRVSTEQICLNSDRDSKLANASLRSPGIPSLGRRN